MNIKAVLQLLPCVAILASCGNTTKVYITNPSYLPEQQGSYRLRIAPHQFVGEMGDKIQIIIDRSVPVGVSDSVIFRTSSSSTVSVSANGIVSLNSPGLARVYAKLFADSAYVDTLVVTVNNRTALTIKFGADSVRVQVGKSYDIPVQVKGKAGVTTDFTCASLDVSVVRANAVLTDGVCRVTPVVVNPKGSNSPVIVTATTVAVDAVTGRMTTGTRVYVDP